MDRALVDRIARSVLYEGYLLYPYRPSSMKNAQRWTFGTLYPESWVRAQNGSDRCTFQTEFLYEGPDDAPMSILGRFLIEGNETEVAMETLISQGCRRSLGDSELIYSSEALGGDTFKLNLTMRNTSGIQTTDTETVRRHALGSAHAIVSVSEGELVSMTDPPAYLEAAAGLCRNQGVWPVLIGANGERDTVLASPIILPDYPEVAPESAGDLSDATEIEEILTLRILTLTDDEKAEIRKAEDYGRRILERSESLPAEHLMKLHGTIRGLAPTGTEPWSAWDNWANGTVADSVRVNGADLKAGDRVRLHPVKRADIFDTVLDRRMAVIAGIEQDFENNVHVAVVLEDDPGRDLGELRQTGHRFFFSPEEIELP